VEDKRQLMKLLDEAAAFHGHLCTGQIVGVRVAMLGLRELGIFDPLGVDRKKIVVFVEVARCFADAIMTVTGCRVGKRSFKLMDTGKVAATFLNMTTGRAVRIGLLADIAEVIAKRYPGQEANVAEKQAFLEMSDNDLFSRQDVKISLKDEDTPGIPVTKARCTLCGETILDKRGVQLDGRSCCHPCATGQSYYSLHSSVPEKFEKEIF
jgi:formylmethanofuran dehydrogenase subunit E